MPLPSAARFKDTKAGYRRFTSQAIRALLKEGKPHQQAVAQTLAMWRKEHGRRRQRAAALRVASMYVNKGE